MKAFESIARVGFLRRKNAIEYPAVGAEGLVDVEGGDDWRSVASADALFTAWGPPQTSPWAPFHRPTLFAAYDSLGPRVPPLAVPGFPPGDAPRGIPPWAGPSHAVAVDLPGEASVAYAALLAARWGYEPVVTFNNWPDRRGLVDMGKVLSALLYFSPWVVEGRANRDPSAVPPPVFVLDSRRFAPGREPQPGDFDNRYYLMESDLPSGAQFKRAGIERLVYVVGGGADMLASATESDDLNLYLNGLTKVSGLDVATADPTTWGWTAGREFSPALRKTVFTTTKDPAFAGFRRSAAGGFGALVPQPGSGGGFG